MSLRAACLTSSNDASTAGERRMTSSGRTPSPPGPPAANAPPRVSSPARNARTMRTKSPTWIASPGAISTVWPAASRWLWSTVPLAEPRSSIANELPRMCRTACRRDTCGPSRRTVASGARPMVSSPLFGIGRVETPSSLTIMRA